MKKQFLNIIFFFIMSIGYAQLESGLILGLSQGTTAEINALTGMTEGQVLYNTDTKNIVIYDSSAWVNSSNANWSQNGNNSATGSFLGTTNDAIMDINSNSTSVLQLGRRQTLGLTQNVIDYNDGNQYITYLKGTNGVSALQFQADAASFYKPIFFTTSDGNFRLKGGSAGTDFFELGSTGVSNNGGFEFIIGDDGAEPFIFKRYDYRDQLNKELFRIQGASNSQNAKPRVGINTGQLANSTLEVNGSVSNAITTASNNLTLDETHHTVLLNSNTSITLPVASSCKGRYYIIKNTNSSAITISSYLDSSGINSTNIPSNSTIHVQSNGVNWEMIGAGAATSNNLTTNKSYVQTYKGNKSFGSGNATRLNLFPQITIQAGKQIKIDLYVPTRDSSTGWGGLYVNINANVNGTWYNLGNTGFDGGVMHSGATSIHALNHEMLLDFITHLNLPIDQPYTLRFELTARSYSGTTTVNQSHDINRTASNLASRGALQTWASDQNYCHIIITERDR